MKKVLLLCSFIVAENGFVNNAFCSEKSEKEEVRSQSSISSFSGYFEQDEEQQYEEYKKPTEELYNTKDKTVEVLKKPITLNNIRIYEEMYRSLRDYHAVLQKICSDLDKKMHSEVREERFKKICEILADSEKVLLKSLEDFCGSIEEDSSEISELAKSLRLSINDYNHKNDKDSIESFAKTISGYMLSLKQEYHKYIDTKEPEKNNSLPENVVVVKTNTSEDDPYKHDSLKISINEFKEITLDEYNKLLELQQELENKKSEFNQLNSLGFFDENLFNEIAKLNEKFERLNINRAQ